MKQYAIVYTDKDANIISEIITTGLDTWYVDASFLCQQKAKDAGGKALNTIEIYDSRKQY